MNKNKCKNVLKKAKRSGERTKAKEKKETYERK